MIQINSNTTASLLQLLHCLIFPIALIMLHPTLWVGSYHCLTDLHHPIYLTLNLNQNYRDSLDQFLFLTLYMYNKIKFNQ
ncbi:hypothetical protein DFH28DRAFT_895314 [Melampsora americana]|nr:hypothetical protein DFH28DRAFT_895314 [Melampsora americana]